MMKIMRISLLSLALITCLTASADGLMPNSHPEEASGNTPDEVPASTPVKAPEKAPVNVTLEARASYIYTAVDGEKQKEGTGFQGDIADIFVEGNLNEKFSYKYRQRLNGINKDKTFFDATDWLYLRYDLNSHFAALAGKWIVGLGSWEYDPTPIDSYQVCEFAYHLPCYQWGANLIFTTDSQKSVFIAQACTSPLGSAYHSATGKPADMYAYNLMWFGQYGFYRSIWSVNELEYRPGKFMNCIVLGNRFDLGDQFRIDVDLFNRAAGGQKFLFRDYSIATKIFYNPSSRFHFFARYAHEENRSGSKADALLLDGTRLDNISAGVEYFPLGNDKLRIHANGYYSFGDNTNSAGVLLDKQVMVSFGLTWRMKLL